MHKLIAIFSKNRFNIDNNFNNDIIYVDNNYTYIDNYSVGLNNEILYFEYIITDDLKFLNKTNVLIDNNYAITNNVFQTSVDNIYAIGEANNSKFVIDEQLKIVLENIFDY